MTTERYEPAPGDRVRFQRIQKEGEEFPKVHFATVLEVHPSGKAVKVREDDTLDTVLLTDRVYIRKDEPIPSFQPGVYIYGEDLATGHIGPFATREEALAHLEFQRERGDASVIHHGLSGVNALRTAEEAHAEAVKDGYANVTRPEEDKAPPGEYGYHGITEDILPRDSNGRRIAVGDKVRFTRKTPYLHGEGVVDGIGGEVEGIVLEDGTSLLTDGSDHFEIIG